MSEQSNEQPGGTLSPGVALALTLQMLMDPKGSIIMCTDACKRNDLWRDTLPDALQLAYEMAEKGFSCDCGECTTHPIREIHIWRVDFAHPEREVRAPNELGVVELLEQEAHGYAVCWQHTTGDVAYERLGAKLSTKVTQDTEKGPQVDFLL